MRIDEFINNNPNYDIKKYNQVGENGFIYFICEDNGKIIYIGTTVSLDRRFMDHNNKIEFSKKPVFFFEAPKEKCLEIEKKLIYKIKPKYNIWGTGNGDKHRNIIQREYQSRKDLDIKRNIIVFMKEREMSQSQFAKELGFSRQRLSQLLKDDALIPDDILAKIITIMENPAFIFRRLIEARGK